MGEPVHVAVSGRGVSAFVEPSVKPLDLRQVLHPFHDDVAFLAVCQLSHLGILRIRTVADLDRLGHLP